MFLFLKFLLKLFCIIDEKFSLKIASRRRITRELVMLFLKKGRAPFCSFPDWE
ncbi:hypothetical protein BN1224_CV14_A_03610 [Chlamydia pneumoniae]|uniref:Uncharacterized protein n=1 Tax=Chlamydia pneumoniae TaxID=83558 RepID=A0A0F7XJU6_CHLPN|nr:hypothetical protein BN1224_CV14_A_03610 [Chlamydia pneumoniae]CRI37965.1 hypothetical protein BN1224_CV15_B_02880 [Chlamydia pneumoniae]CRI39100.1 hypothetical protein BN1224_CWL011_A_03640 [Chlamydia pneumoniae]CRI40231.1 hypothetical protein CWL029c_C_01910 [Chlamydia pneumoniae]CRI44696.1 hypothetical protein BN1224_K7_A_03620 [Chlamydia pneumoniae]